MPGSLCSSLLWPKPPLPTQVGKMQGATLNLSRALEGSDRWGFLLPPMPDPPGGGRHSLGISWVCPTEARATQPFRGTCCTAGSTQGLDS